MYMLKCYDHRCTYVSLQPMYLMERVKLLTLAKHNTILLFYNEILQTCNFVDSCLNYRFSLAFMWIPDCDDSSICLRQKDFIDDSKMCHELYNVKPTYNYY